MIPEIASQMVKISSTLKTCDTSDIDLRLALVSGKCGTAKLVSRFPMILEGNVKWTRASDGPGGLEHRLGKPSMKEFDGN